MKNLFALMVFICLSGFAYGQISITGLVKRTNGDSVNGARVYIYPDTTTGPPPFATLTDTTVFGGFKFTLSSASLPVGTKFYVSTLDCDSTTYITNTHIYTGGSNVTSNLTICVVAPTNFSGYVFLGTAAKRPQPKQAMVYLISKCPGNMLTFIDSVETDTNGFYAIDTFPKLATGCELIMKARLLPISPDYKKYLPAYHETNTKYSLRWSGARDIPLSVAKGGIIILLPEAINPSGGPSVIAGYAKDEATGSRLPGKILLMTDMNDVTVDYTYTNSVGDFAFNNIPFGTYKVFGDVWGKDNPDLVVKVSADVVYIFNIIFRENDTLFKGSIATSIAAANNSLNGLSMYPNPAGEYVYIRGAESLSGSKQVTLTDISGNLVQIFVFDAGKPLALPVAALSKGVYILQMKTAEGTAVFRLVK